MFTTVFDKNIYYILYIDENNRNDLVCSVSMKHILLFIIIKIMNLF